MKSVFLQSGESFPGSAFGAEGDAFGEVVFTTGMSGYLETLTDPSYYGQIVTFTAPLIGNYGVFDEKAFCQTVDEVYESQKIWVRGVILTEHSLCPSHELAAKRFEKWLADQGVPGISGVDTRHLTTVLREHGTIMGGIAKSEQGIEKYFEDPLKGRFVPEVSPTELEILEPQNFSGKTIAFLDCGAKNGIFRNFLSRGIRVLRFPFDANPFTSGQKFDGLFIANGPGDPETCHETIATTKEALEKDIPVFGICLGNQILALAAGAKTRKMKYGHRGFNQPVQEVGKKENCLITSQNHGYEVDPTSLPSDYEVWFKNLNDGSVEGIRHKTKPIFSVQFHPEACGGPEEASYLFDAFIEQL